jgi:hypothetical protein
MAHAMKRMRWRWLALAAAGALLLALTVHRRQLVLFQLRQACRWRAGESLSKAAAGRSDRDWIVALGIAVGQGGEEAVGYYVRAANLAPESERGLVYLCALRHSLTALVGARTPRARPVGPQADADLSPRIADAEHWATAARQADPENGYLWAATAYLAILRGQNQSAAACLLRAADMSRFENGQEKAWRARAYTFESLGLAPHQDGPSAFLIASMLPPGMTARWATIARWLKESCLRLAQAQKPADAVSLAGAAAVAWQRTAETARPRNGPAGPYPLADALVALRDQLIRSGQAEPAIAAARLLDTCQQAWIQAGAATLQQENAFWESVELAQRVLLLRVVVQTWLTLALGCGLVLAACSGWRRVRRDAHPPASQVGLRGSVLGRAAVVVAAAAWVALLSATRVGAYRQGWAPRLGAIPLPTLSDNLGVLLMPLGLVWFWVATQPYAATRWRGRSPGTRASLVSVAAVLITAAVLISLFLATSGLPLLSFQALLALTVILGSLGAALYLFTALARWTESAHVEAEQQSPRGDALATCAALVRALLLLASAGYAVGLLWDTALCRGFHWG